MGLRQYYLSDLLSSASLPLHRVESVLLGQVKSKTASKIVEKSHSTAAGGDGSRKVASPELACT